VRLPLGRHPDLAPFLQHPRGDRALLRHPGRGEGPPPPGTL